MARIDISVLNHSQQTAVFGGFPERALQARRGSSDEEEAVPQRHDQNGQQPLAQVTERLSQITFFQLSLILSFHSMIFKDRKVLL